MHVFGWDLATVGAMDLDELDYWTDEAERLYVALHSSADDS